MRRTFPIFGLFVVVFTSACNARPRQAERSEDEGEDLPAPPCSVNAMLARDTADTEFEQCGVTKLPLSGAVATCAREAVAEQQPFVVQLKFGPFSPPQRRPALVGAHFDGAYALRTYMPRGMAGGDRTEVELVITGPDTDELATMAKSLRPLKCKRSATPPQDGDYVPVDGRAYHRFDAARCSEWFDDRAWSTKPWPARHDPGAVVRCAPP